MTKTLLRISLSLILLLVAGELSAQPELYSWIRNTTGAVGYNNIPSNVQAVNYTTTDVYVSATCIPGYSIGPWTNNPNTASNRNFIFKITRNPVQNTGTTTATPLGNIGVWSNGVSIFNADDGMSYNNANVWNRNALFWEGVSFDNCLGHPQQNGTYHHHVNPRCLYNDADSLNHSPIIGYAFDGFPVYGAYGFANTNGTGSVKRMSSSYVLADPNATTRINGPAVNVTYPLGCFLEDYMYAAGTGDLDEHNGRFCVTPDYPLGIYAYFVTIDAALDPVFPFVIGPRYYGVVQPGNTGPNGSNNIIPGTAIAYTGTTGIDETNATLNFIVAPNPAGAITSIYFPRSLYTNIRVEIYDSQGKLMQNLSDLQAGKHYDIQLSDYATGVYFLRAISGNKFSTQRLLHQSDM